MHAQWDPQISQYWRVKTFYNPAFAGETSELQASALYRHQWVGIKNAPKTFIVTADMPLQFLGKLHGVGATMMSESIGLYSNTSFAAQYAYKKKWNRWKNNTLNIGLQVGLTSIGFDAGGIYLPGDEGKDDPAIPTSSEQSSVFDGGLGVSFVTPKYYVGFSVAHITQPKFELGENSESYIARTYYFTGGYNIQFRNSLYELQPSFLVKSDAVVTQYDVTMRLVYNKMFNGGLSWRKDDGFVFLLGFKYKGIDAGYAYDLSTSAISKVSSGSHEIFLRYAIPMNLDKKDKNSHKSVRIL